MFRAAERAGLLPLLGFFAVLTLLIAVSARVPVLAGEVPRQTAVVGVEDLVRAVAWYGPGQLSAPEYETAYATSEGRAVPMLLLAAWARLSLARLGWLDVVTASRLPWLGVAAMGPALSYAVVRERVGDGGGAVAGLALLVVPAWWTSALGGGEWAVILGVWLAALRMASVKLPPRCREVMVALVIGWGATIHAAAVLGLVWVWARRQWDKGGWARGHVTVPASVLWGAVVVPLLLWALNPSLWGSSVIELVRWALLLWVPRGSHWAAGWGAVPPALLALAGVFALGFATEAVVKRWRGEGLTASR